MNKESATHHVRVNPRLLLNLHLLVDECLCHDLENPAKTRHGELLRHAVNLLTFSASDLVRMARQPKVLESKYVLLNASDLRQMAREMGISYWSADILSFVEGWCPRDEVTDTVLQVLVRFTKKELGRI